MTSIPPFLVAEAYNKVFSSDFTLQIKEDSPEEKLLHIIWNEKLAGENFTYRGQSIAILHPGRWNCDNSGPDFSDAVIAINNDILQGSIEIHKRPEDWHAHGHHRDSHYDNVILHVLWHNPTNCQIPKTTPYICIKNNLTADIRILEQRWQPKLYGKSQKYPTEKEAFLLEAFTDLEIQKLFQAAATARILRKSQAITSSALNIGLAQTLYEKLLDALGYSNNRLAFRILAKTAPLTLIKKCSQPNERLAVFWGSSNLLPDPTQASIDNKLIDQTIKIWQLWGQKRDCYAQLQWNRHGNRPGNSPERRVAAAFHLLEKHHWQPDIPLHQFIKLPNKELHQSLMQYLDISSLWENFYSFSRPCKNPLKLIGRSRCLDIIINVMIPTLMHLSQDPKNYLKLIDYLLALPKLQSNQNLDRGQFRYFIPPERMKRCINSAAMQQGFLQFTKDFHNHFREENQDLFWQKLTEVIKDSP